MLINNLSLDEEDAVQAELKELQQETVSSLTLEESLGSLIITSRLVTCSAQRRYTALAPGCSHYRTRIIRTGYFTSHLVTRIADLTIRRRDPTTSRRDANRASCDPCLTATGEDRSRVSSTHIYHR